MTHVHDPRDPVLDLTVVLDLARRHVPAVQSVTAVDESGGEARTYFLDDTWVFKTQRPHRVRPRTSLEKETFHLRELARQVPNASVPRVHGYGREADVEYILMTRMPGVPLRQAPLAGASRARFLRELGAMLRQVHAIDARPLRASGLFPGDADRAAIRQRLESELERAVELASAAASGWTLPMSPGVAADQVRSGLLHIEDGPVPLHSNPGPEHVFVDPDTARLTGVIDFGDAYFSHPALDFRRWADPADRVALMDGYTAEGPTSEAFAANWRAISVVMLMQDYATRPGRRAESLAGLRTLLYAWP